MTHRIFWKYAAGLGIAALAAALFLINIGSQEFYGDNVGYAFRSLGYLDYLGTSFQTQPVDWYEASDLPWWTRLSFHDHPPLAFIIQNLFLRLFGPSVTVARLPAILFGFLSIGLLYLIIRRLFNSELLAGLAALSFAINTASAAMFRSALIEPIQMGFILLFVYAFFIFLDKSNSFWFLGVSLGLLLLTKYTGIFLIAAILVYLALFRRDIFTRKEFWFTILIAILIFSPVIIYNILLYLDRGHFDLQISTFLGQKVEAWQDNALLGKIQSPFSEIFQNAKVLFDPATLGLAVFGAVLLAGLMVKHSPVVPLQWRAGVYFFALYAAFLTIMLTVVGSAHRFLFLYAPVTSPLVGLVAYWTLTLVRWRPLAIGLLVAMFGFIFWHSYRANVIQIVDYGIVKLDSYFSKEFEGRPSAIIPETKNPHLNKIIHDFAARKISGQPHFSVIVYNDNVDIATILWVFSRRFFYENIPTMDVSNFQQIASKEGQAYFKGFTIYFVQSTPNALLNPLRGENEVANAFEKNLIVQGLKPAAIVGSDFGREFFRVYKLEL